MRITGGVTIAPELAEPVRDSWAMHLLREDIHDNIVQVSYICQ